MLSLDTIPTPTAGVVGRVVDNEAVLVLPNKGEVKVLNEVGAFIWSQVDGERSIGVIARMVCKEYEADIKVAESDTLVFINDLVERGVVNIHT